MVAVQDGVQLKIIRTVANPYDGDDASTFTLLVTYASHLCMGLCSLVWLMSNSNLSS